MLLEAGRTRAVQPSLWCGSLAVLPAPTTHFGLGRPGRLLAHHAAAAAGAGAARPLSAARPPACSARSLLCLGGAHVRARPRPRSGPAARWRVVQEVSEELAHTLVACGWERQTAGLARWVGGWEGCAQGLLGPGVGLGELVEHTQPRPQVCVAPRANP